jgi:hypothetical protein
MAVLVDIQANCAAAVKCRSTLINFVMLAAKLRLRALKINPAREIDFDAYPFSVSAICELEQMAFHPDCWTKAV